MGIQQKKQIKKLKIREKCKKRILNWAKSKNEIGFLCAGKRKKITHVFKIRNKSRTPLHRFKWDLRQRDKIRNEITKRGLRLIAEGHSHPNARHLRSPSTEDLAYFDCTYPHLIAFPISGEVKGWYLGSDTRTTRTNEIAIKYK